MIEKKVGQELDFLCQNLPTSNIASTYLPYPTPTYSRLDP